MPGSNVASNALPTAVECAGNLPPTRVGMTTPPRPPERSRNKTSRPSSTARWPTSPVR